jgi:hypothetical protein
MKNQTLLTTLGIAAIMLVLGTALGSVAFPMTKTQTSTNFETLTVNHIMTLEKTQNNGSYFVIYSSNGNLTITKEIIKELVEHLSIDVSGNCTVPQETIFIQNTTETRFVFLSFESGVSMNPNAVNATITTVTFSSSGIGSTSLTTLSFNISQYGNATQIILSTRTNGTETYVATATCPIMA